MHRRIGQTAGRGDIDLLIAIGAQARALIDAAMQERADLETACFSDTPSAADTLAELLRPGDAVLLKGSRGMKLETLVPAIARAFDTTASASADHGQDTLPCSTI